MKAFSVKWPWSGLIAWGLKPHEIRTWRTRVRGKLLVCSSASPSRDDDARRVDMTCAPQLGVALCVVELVDCRPFFDRDAQGAWCAPSRCPRSMAVHGNGHEWNDNGKAACRECGQQREYVWELRLVYEVERVPVTGRLNFFDVDDALVRAASFEHPTPRLLSAR